jgi:hypothetical protein
MPVFLRDAFSKAVNKRVTEELCELPNPVVYHEMAEHYDTAIIPARVRNQKISQM